jgi:hypothetical protein
MRQDTQTRATHTYTPAVYLPLNRRARISIWCTKNAHTHIHTTSVPTDYEPHADRPAGMPRWWVHSHLQSAPTLEPLAGGKAHAIAAVAASGMTSAPEGSRRVYSNSAPDLLMAGKASSPLPPLHNPSAASEGIKAVKGLRAEESEESSKLLQVPVSALEILCSDLRMSGFNSPAFLTPELSQERRKMLLDRTVHLKGHLALQPSALILTLSTAPTLQSLAISCGLDSRHELTVLEEELDGVKFWGLGLANKHSKVWVYVNVYHTHIYTRASSHTLHARKHTLSGVGGRCVKWQQFLN